MSRSRDGRTTAGVSQDLTRLRRVFALVPWRMRWRVIGLLCAAAFSSLLDIVAVATMVPLTQILTSTGELPELVRHWVVPLAGTDDRRTVVFVMALFVAGAFIVKNVSLIFIRWWSLGITQDASAAAQAELFRRYMAAPYIDHRRRARGRIMQTLAGAVPAAFTGTMLGYITIIVYGLSVILLSGTLLVIAPLASIAAVIIFGGSSVLISQLLRPRARRVSEEILAAETGSWQILAPGVDGFREARVYRRESLFTERYDRNREAVADHSRVRGILAELPKYILEISMVAGILVVALILFATRDDSTALGLLAMFAAASMRIIPALNLVVATYNGIVSSRAALEMVIEELDDLGAGERREESGDGAEERLESGDIVVSELGFRYPDGGADVLSDVSVTIPFGRTVALVGGSGAGKTTFADILAGLLTATDGSVRVNGQDIADSPRAWRANVAMVSQRVYLWDASLRELITFGQPEHLVDEGHLSDVIHRSRLDRLVAELPEGLETSAGEGGIRLSGGQAQRVGIARALYSRPEVLILDEATSALDNETEHQITETISEIHGQVTVIVIAHRLSTVKNADEILFFDEGRLRSRGNMADLRRTDEKFARLVELGTLTA